ncbi:MAG: hypothetical protein WC905_04395 [Patescibacteria group bacterium]
MNDLYALLSDKDCLKSTKFYENVELKCSCCGKLFLKHKRDFLKSVRLKRDYITCSRECRDKMQITSKKVKCEQCGKSIERDPCQLRKCKHVFCSRVCSGIYTAAHKTTGCNRSKLEIWLEEQLTILYPNLNIIYNDTKAIKAELDVYIPSLKLAFELNGIFHYEPIFGGDRLLKTQNKDQQKFKLCHDNNISLCVIDTTQQKQFKIITSQKFLDIITNIINQMEP